MKNIKILGTGCPKCKKTIAIVEETVQKLGLDARVEKVEDIMEIMSYQVLSTPAIVIDGQVVFKGGVPSAREVTDLLSR